MRKILSALLATAMVASMSATMSFAATSAAVSPKTSATVSAVIGAAEVTVDHLEAVVKDKSSTETYTFGPSKSFDATTGYTTAAVAKAFDGATLHDIDIDGRRYTMTLKEDKDNAGDMFATLTPASEIDKGTEITVYFIGTDGKRIQNAGSDVNIPFTFTTAAEAGSGGITADVEASGSLNKLSISDVIECDGQGNPIPLTEKKDGADLDQNGEQGVQSSKTLYFMLKDTNEWKIADDNYWKLKISKGNNGKYIKAVTDVNKNFSSNLYDATTNAVVKGTSGRHRFIKVELAEIFTDDEYKITLDLRLTPKDPAIRLFKLDDDTEIKVKDFSFWMKNIVKEADNDWKVGIGGLMLNPLENDWNEVTYFDEDGDLAFMKFFADSDVSKFYAKLSTKWEHADYASYFNDQDAYIFDFVGSPKISATSRCDLEIYNPFVNDNGDETIDPATATIYQVIDGDLFDVTDSFEYKEGQNGDMAYTTRTRFLGTYIICEKPVEEAVDKDTNVPTDLVPEETNPSEVTPGNDNGGKAPANTGKYL